MVAFNNYMVFTFTVRGRPEGMRACAACSLFVAVLVTTVGGVPCVDEDDDDCSAWAKAGECFRNAAFMSVSCRKSCMLCGKRVKKKKGANLEEDNGQLAKAWSEAAGVGSLTALAALKKHCCSQ